jgi:hypothetical protein
MSSFVYRIYGMGAAMVVLAFTGAYHSMERAANWRPAKAEVSYIDRKCTIIRTTYDENYKPEEKQTFTDSCNSIDEWDKVRTKRNKTVDGTAVVHLSYNAPQGGQPETAELTFDGRDDEFYNLKAGDRVDILVSNSDPTKIQKS